MVYDTDSSDFPVFNAGDIEKLLRYRGVVESRPGLEERHREIVLGILNVAEEKLAKTGRV